MIGTSHLFLNSVGIKLFSLLGIISGRRAWTGGFEPVKAAHSVHISGSAPDNVHGSSSCCPHLTGQQLSHPGTYWILCAPCLMNFDHLVDLLLLKLSIGTFKIF